MGKIVRSARGAAVDFELLAIKAQLASTPIPKHVEERKRVVDAKDGLKTDQVPDLEFMNVALAAAAASAGKAEPEEEAKPKKAKQATQLDRK